MGSADIAGRGAQKSGDITVILGHGGGGRHGSGLPCHGKSDQEGMTDGRLQDFFAPERS